MHGPSTVDDLDGGLRDSKTPTDKDLLIGGEE